MEFRVDDPIWLFLLIPALAYFGITGWNRLMKGRALYRIVFILRIAAVSLLVIALAAPSIYRPTNEQQIIFLMDRSASMEGSENELSALVESAMAAKNDSQAAGVFTFAEDFQTLLQVTDESRPLPKELTVNQDTHTNIAQALELAANIGDTDLATRLVLLSDGNETRSSVLESLDRLQSDRLQVDVFPVDQKDGSDVSLTSFETPSRAFLGESQEFSVEIDADTSASGELVFSVNDEEMDRQSIELAEGQNIFSYSFPAENEGLMKYEARIEVENDAFLQNNALISVTEVEGNPELLIVNGEEASPIGSLVDNDNIRVSNVAASELPETLSSILSYDAIIFDNVSGTAVGEQQMNVIEQAVKEFGVGFMMVGGDQSYGLGGYFKTPIERILPVEMEVKGKHELPSLGLVIVMDRSGSMAGQKMELAKEAAARSVELLRKDDVVGVIAFDDRPWQILPTEKLADPKSAVDDILSITPGGGTEIYSSLAEAYSQLEDLELQRKHIILLTDGQAATSGDYNALIEDGKGENITLSTIAIGQDADRNLLESLAVAGSGRFYDVVDATTIPAILSRETVMMSRTYIVDEPFHPVIYDSAWSSLFEDGVPEMNAYIATTPKETASVIAESEEQDPVLAEWNYGLGKTIAYTSGSGAWSGDFQAWSNWPAFWNRNVTELLPSFEETPFSVTRKEQGIYTVEDPSQSSAILNVTVIDEQGEEVPAQTEPIAPGKVEVSLDADPGLVFFSISNETRAAFKTGLTIPYGDEFRSSAANLPLLTAVAERTGGQVLESLDDAFREIPFESGTLQPIRQQLILLAMILFFLDISLRRFGFKLPGRKQKLQEEAEEKTETIEQLIKAKQRS